MLPAGFPQLTDDSRYVTITLLAATSGPVTILDFVNAPNILPGLGDG